MLMRNRDNYQPWIVKHPTISYEDPNSSPVGSKTKANSQRIICDGCYILDNHILSDCNHSIIDPETTVRNYEALDADRKDHVPDKYYIVAKTLLKENPEHQLAQEVKETSQPKT